MLKSDREFLPTEINRRKPEQKKTLCKRKNAKSLVCVSFIDKDLYILYIQYVITASDPQSKRDHPTKQVGAAEDCAFLFLKFFCVEELNRQLILDILWLYFMRKSFYYAHLLFC